MRVLVACEFSGLVRRAFRALGHDAWSCDLLPAEDGGPHIQGDVLNRLADGWDLMIAHPPCTYLCSSGLHWNHRVPGRQQLTEDALAFVCALLDAPIPRIALENPVGCIGTRIRKAVQFVQPWQFGHNASKTTCLWLKGLPCLKPTNIVPPSGWVSVRFASDLPACDCCGEPYCDEHQTHYWECQCVGPTQDGYRYKEVLGCLFATDAQDGPQKMLWANQTPSGQNKMGPSPDRWKERSRTYEGIAKAMADQWGRSGLLNEEVTTCCTTA